MKFEITAQMLHIYKEGVDLVIKDQQNKISEIKQNPMQEIDRAHSIDAREQNIRNAHKCLQTIEDYIKAGGIAEFHIV